MIWDEGNNARIEAEKECAKQKQEDEDSKRAKDISELRNLPAGEGGFMFKAREIERGVVTPNKNAPIHHSSKPLTQPQTPILATDTRSRHCCNIHE